jgi:ABC-type glycerol-3-phosphate transport system substrate-binding protein
MLALCLCGSACREQISPHVAAEPDPEVLVAGLSAANVPQQAAVHQPATARPAGKVILTLNNAPAPNELFELEIVQRLVELFEQRNPDIQIEFSTWRFTPESLYERAKTHTLTDVVEVSVDQMQPIIDLSLAADMTSYLGSTPEVQSLNPAAVALTTRDGRLFGVPLELQTMAIFYNRSLVEPVLNPKPEKGDRKSEKKNPEKKPSKGGGTGDSYEGTEAFAAWPVATPFILAQARRYGGSYYEYSQTDDSQNDEGNSYARRGEQQVENDYQVAPRPRFRWPFRALTPVRTPAAARRAPFWRRSQMQESSDVEEEANGTQSEEDLESARPAAVTLRGAPAADTDEEAPESARPQAAMPPPKETPTTTTAHEEEITATVVKEDITTAVRLPGLPANWEDFIRLAVKLTDHEKGQYGYAPVLFAADGGREYIQWSVLAGLDASRLPEPAALARLRGEVGLDSLQFLRDLRWRYDVMPPAERCYGDNVLKMFAEGKIAMIMMPATKDSVRRLMRAGMAPDHIGVAPLPMGPASRQHLVFGRCVIVNSQTDEARRRAAAQWIRFLLDPEVTRIREQYLFREQDLTGIPHVPLYRKDKQDQLYTMLKPYRLLPVFADYEDTVTTGLMPEPARLRYELYEELAKEVRPVLEKKDVAPETVAATLVSDFEKRYLTQAVPQKMNIESYLRLFTLPRK